jgi:hypothetical protein
MGLIRFHRATLCIAVLITSFLFSCCSSNDVASSHLLQKRKHRSGFHLNLGSNQHKPTKSIDLPEKQMEIAQKSPSDSPEDIRSLDEAKPPKSDNFRSKKLVRQIAELKAKKKRVQREFGQVLENVDTKFQRKKVERIDDDPYFDKNGEIMATIALIFGVASILLIIPAIAVTGPAGLIIFGLSFVASIAAMVLGGITKKDFLLGQIGFILGIIIMITYIIILLLIIIVVILLLSFLSGF